MSERAGLSTSWLTWLEQGREVNASVETLARLASALELSPAERASLFDLSGKRDPSALVPVDADLPSELLALPSGFAEPAYLLNQVWTARAWNRPAADLFSGWLGDEAEDRNLLVWAFLSPTARLLAEDWLERVGILVAELRADYNRRPDDPAFNLLIDQLVKQSPTFAEFWHSQHVRDVADGERSLIHPLQGPILYRQTTLFVAKHPYVQLVCFMPLPAPPAGES